MNYSTQILSQDELTDDEDKKRSFHESINTKPVKKIDYTKRVFEFNPPLETPISKDNDIEPLTKEQLRTRYHTQETINELTNDIKIMTINKILAKITKPDYKEPNYDNWGIIGFITEKSDILKTVKNDRYLKLRIGDFNHSITINLFDEGFKKFWNLSIGDLIILLNPNIHKHSKGFDFFINESLNNILKIGIIKNITKCNDSNCNRYVNSKYKYCEFHESKVEKSFLKNQRMELNGSVKLFNPLQKQHDYIQDLNEQSKIYGMNSNFNLEKYHDGNIFSKNGSKRKLKDEKSNKNLESKLLKLPDRSKYENLGLIKKSVPVKKLNSSQKNLKSLTDELKSLTKDKKINLGMSKRDKLEKKKKWQDTMKILDSKSTPNNQKEVESDDDLDIVVNKSNYELMKSYEMYKRKTNP